MQRFLFSTFKTVLTPFLQVCSTAPTISLLAFSLLLGVSPSSIAEEDVVQTETSLRHSQSTLNQPLSRLEDGIYLYGQSLQPDQIGQAYMIFEAVADEVVGAFYMPFSSFDCFQGNVHSDRLALEVVNSYTDESHSYEVALDQTAPIASTTGITSPFALEGFHPLANVSDNDYRILSTCKADRVTNI